MGRVDGKVALITGAARGQGRSHALRLAEEGADVVAIDVCAGIRNVRYPASTKDQLEETAELVRARGQQAIPIQLDVRDQPALESAAATAVSELGRLDIVVANAGICITAPWDECTDEIWQDTIDINLTGVWNTIRACAGHLVAQNGGSIIIISSGAGVRGIPFMPSYVASKWGITGLAIALAQELAEHNVRVNSIHPGGVNTPMAGTPEFRKALADHPRLAGMFTHLLPVSTLEPIDISNAVLYLASDESRYVTASQFVVDAGGSQY
jgi:SDR family mycofactocin-dependent oxidoreductase